MKKKHLMKEAIIFSLGMILLLIVTIIFGIFYFELDLPNVSDLKHIRLQVPMRIFSRDNKLIAEFGDIKRIPVTLDQVPKQLIDATLATEDQRFYFHSGVDPMGLARAFLILVTTGKKWEGGSTITMQVARSFFLTPKKTYTRKIKEILLALKIDHEFSKEKILELYFNQNFYGNRAYGVAAATQAYFGKSLDQLTLPEAALLAGLPKAPSKLNPLINPKAAKNRRDHVLKRMFELKYIDQKNYRESISSPITADYHGFTIAVHAPYVAEMVRQLMVSQYGDDVYSKGLTIYTTIDSFAQKSADESLLKYLQMYDHRHGYEGPEQNIGDYNANNLSNWLEYLRKIHTINGLRPAIVVKVDDFSAQAILKTGQFITIPWEGMSWAKKRIVRDNQEFFGARPRNASDILHVGDVVRVFKADSNDWELTQIPASEAAIVAMNSNDGAILALCGGFNFYKSKFNRAIQAERQPGSAFKPFVYSAALAKGLTLATVINDSPIAIPAEGNNNELWRPENDSKRFYGPTRLREALIKSRNIVSIKLLELIGIPYTIDYVTKFGFDHSTLPQTLSLALGSGTVTPLQMTAGFAVFSNGGFKVTPYFIDHINDLDNHVIYQASPTVAMVSASSKTKPLNQKNSQINQAPRVISPQNAFLISSTLQEVIKRGTGVKALYLNRSDLSGKTGTTNNQMDAWFCGYNGNIVSTVWVGYDQPRSLYEQAFTAAVPMWADFTQKIFQNQPVAPIPRPANIITARISKKSGLLVGERGHGRDAATMLEFFERGTEPKTIELPSSPGSGVKTENATDENKNFDLGSSSQSPGIDPGIDTLY